MAGRLHAAVSPGTQLWVKRYNSGGRAASVAASPTGNMVFVTGASLNAAQTGFDYATVAYNATTGAQVWAERYISPGTGADQANAVAVSPDGKTVYVTGYIGLGLVGYGTIAYNAATGAQVWAKNYHGVGPGFNQAYSVATSPTGNTVYVTGYSATNGAPDNAYATVAYDAATGAQLWVKRYKGPGPNAQAYSLAVSPTTGTVYVTGQDFGGFATIAYSG